MWFCRVSSSPTRPINLNQSLEVKLKAASQKLVAFFVGLSMIIDPCHNLTNRVLNNCQNLNQNELFNKKKYTAFTPDLGFSDFPCLMCF